MVPIIKLGLYLFFFLILFTAVSGLNCSNFEEPKIQSRCIDNQEFFQDKNASESRAQKLNLRILNQLSSSENSLSFAKSYNEDISDKEFERYAHDADSLFLDEAWVYIRDPFKSLKLDESSTVLAPGSGEFNVEIGYKPEFGSQSDWQHFSEDFCSDEFRVVGYNDNLKTYVNGDLAGRNQNIDYSVSSDLNVKSNYKVSSKVEVKERRIECRSEDSKSCDPVCRTVSVDTKIFSEEFTDFKSFKPVKSSEEDFKVGFNNRKIILKVRNLYKYRKIRISGKKWSTVLDKQSLGLRISKPYDKVQPYLNNGSARLSSSENISGFEKTRQNTYRMKLRGNLSDCQIKATSVIGKTYSLNCKAEKLEKPSLKIKNVSKYFRNSKKFFNISVSTKGDVDNLKISYNNQTHLISRNNSIPVQFVYSKPGLVKLESRQDGLALTSSDTRFVSWTPVSLQISKLLAAFGALIIVSIMLN